MKPILFNTDMVKAILAGQKTQTRRVIKPQPRCKTVVFEYGRLTEYRMRGACWDAVTHHKPKYQAGDVLYVRETWDEYVAEHIIDSRYVYKADMTPDSEEMRLQYIKRGYPYKWRSLRFMPKEAARIFLRVTDVRVERVRDITDEDAIAEGANTVDGKNVGFEEKMRESAVERYHRIWDSIHAEDGYGWEENPWVWVYEFERVSEGETYAG